MRASAPAMTTRWRIPPDSWCGRSCITESIRGISTSSRSSRTRARGETSSPVSLRAARTSAMSCVPTVSTGLMPASELWGTYAIRCPRMLRHTASEAPVSSVPSKRIEPPVTVAE